METYIGTKLIKAQPMTRLQYNKYRGWDLPANEVGTDAGFLVEYMDGGLANDKRHAGYISWSPFEVFHKSYWPVDGMTFGLALDALKMGMRVARAGWNGKDMWLSLSCGEVREVPAAGFWSPHNQAYANANGGTAKVLPSITMKTATGEILMGWLASQTDMLAEDWAIVGDKP
jgi:hypothetical protein